MAEDSVVQRRDAGSQSNQLLIFRRNIMRLISKRRHLDPSRTELIDALKFFTEKNSLKGSDIASKHQVTETVLLLIIN